MTRKRHSTAGGAKLAERSIATLSSRILEGVYPIGTHLPPERELAGALGTNRNTLRVAMKALEDRGLIERRWGSGVVVRDWRTGGTLGLVEPFLEAGMPGEDVGTALETLAQLRRKVLAELAAIAAARASPAARARIRAAAEALGTHGLARAELLDRELAFLAALADGSGSAIVRWLYNTFAQGFTAAVERMPVLFASPERAGKSLRAVVQAIAARRPMRAREAMDRWVRAIDAQRRKALGLTARR